MKLLRLLLERSKFGVIMAALLGFAGGMGTTALVALIGRQVTLADPFTRQFATWFVILALVSTGANLVSRLLLVQLTEQSYQDLQLRLTRKILSTPLRSLETIGFPRLLATLSSDIGTVSAGLYVVPTIWLNAAILISGVAYLAWLYPLVMAVLLALMIPSVLIFVLFNARARRHLVLARETLDDAFKLFRALTDGIKELKLHYRRRWRFQEDLLRSTILRFRKQRSAGRNLYEIAITWSNLTYFIFIFLLFALATFMSAGVEILTTYTLIALYLRSAIGHLTSAVPVYVNGSIALQKVESLGLQLTEGEAASEHAAPPPATPTWSRLDLHRVALKYSTDEDGNGFQVGPLSLTLYPGELVFITGGNGSGKTTLAKLLVGLYPSESGDIFIDETRIDDGNLEWYREHFSALFSDYYLFDQLIGLEEVDLDVRARRYLEQLQLEHKVTIDRGKLSTVDLSVGQRKRLALLTAYLEDRPIYLLDEWASGQDPHFRDLFYRELLPDLRDRGKLVVVISHDDHYFDVADRIIKLDFGQIETDSLGSVAEPHPTARSEQNVANGRHR